jgi:hypothetical protein
VKPRTAAALALAERPHAEVVHFAVLELDGLAPLRLSTRHIPRQTYSALLAPAVPEIPAIPDGPNLMGNGGFDTDLSQWTVNPLASSVAWSSEHGGSVRTVGDGTTNTELHEDTDVPANVPHRVTVRVDARGANGELLIGSTTGGGDLLTVFPVPVGVTTYSLLLASPTGLISVTLINPSTSSEVFYDDVSVVLPGLAGVPGTPDVFGDVVFDECLNLVDAWGTIEETLDPIAGGGSPATLEGFTLCNYAAVAGRARFSDLIRSPLNPTGYEFAFAKLTISRYDAELGPAAAEVVGVFYLEDPTEIGERTLVLRASDITLVLDNQSPVSKIAKPLFSNAVAALGDRNLPVPFGTLINAACPPIVDAPSGALAASLGPADSTLSLVDASDWASSGTGLVDGDQRSWTGKSGNTLTGLTHVAGTAATHAAGSTFLAMRSDEYMFAAGEVRPGYTIGAIANVRVRGVRLASQPSVTLANSSTVPGKIIATIQFPVSSLFEFHAVPLGQAGLDATNPGVNASLAALSGSLILAVTLPALPATVPDAADVSVSVTVRMHSSVASPSAKTTCQYQDESQPGTVYVGLGSPELDDDTTYSFTMKRYVTTEHIRFTWSTLAAGSTMTVTVVAMTASPASQGGGSGASTASAIFGDVTADITGIKDDAVGSISGTPNLLLEIPADITAYFLVLYPGTSLADRGAHWAATRASQLAAGLKWAFLLGLDGTERFADLRRKITLQSRSQLATEAGTIDLRYLPDTPSVDLVLDYRADVWEQQPALVKRTGRTQLFNRVIVKAQPDLSGSGDFRYQVPIEDLTQPGLTDAFETTLELPWVQSVAVAAALGPYWLGWWRRPRFEIEAVGWQRLFALEKVDHLAVDNHPVLAAHGGVALPFRVFQKTYRLGDDNPSRIGVQAIEAAT